MRRIDLGPVDPRSRQGFIRTGDAVLHITGPGAVACVQGLFTNDIEKGPLPMLRWGAFLSPKGMIISDLWIARDASGCWLIVPEEGVEPVRSLLTRSFPPRLARVTDRSAELAVNWIRSRQSEKPTPSGMLFQPDGNAPFDSLLVAPPDATPQLIDPLPPEVADGIRLLDGWPVLGREIDDRTLVQEVRFDELGGVRYDKGCYVGQETVARLHFRGHPNRTMRILAGSGDPLTDDAVVGAEGREVGRLATLGVTGEKWFGSAKVRREVADGDRVSIGNSSATVLPLPLPEPAF